jgi:O-antigen chain-terminating methyltransferase
MYRIPIFGYVLRFIAGLVQLPIILKNMFKFEAYIQWRFNQDETSINNDKTIIENYLNKTIQSINTSLERVMFEKADSQSVTELAHSIRELADRKAEQELVSILKEQLDEIDASKVNLKDIEQVRQKMNQLTENLRLVAEKKADREMVPILEQKLKEIAASKASVKDMEQSRQKIIELAEKLQEIKANKADQSMVALLQQKIDQMTLLEASMDDAMYVSFENQFRGEREVIKGYQKIYLSYIQEALTGSRESLVIDAGCGRGEWLELLKENGYAAKGLDSNKLMVQNCQNLGLDAIESDVVEYLKKQPQDSIGIITAFHLIEHLTFKTIISLLDESLRVLGSGGMIILETPNPENLIVGACEFYNDPTHKNPIPPDTLKYFVESRGFNRIKVVKLHRDDVQHIDNELLNNLLFGEKDYAVIGYKD